MKAKHPQSPRRGFPLVLPLALAAALLVLVLDAFAAQRAGMVASQGAGSLARLTTATGTGDRDSYAPSLSGDGRVVAFESNSDILNEGRPADVVEIWLYDTVAMTYTRVTSASDSTRDSDRPSLNADGTLVAFYSDSDLLSEGRPDETTEIWLYDTVAMTYTRVTSATGADDRFSYDPSLNADGTVVAFESDSDLLNEGRSGGVYEIWLYDTVAMTYSRVTTASHGNRDCSNPSVSADGTVVAFYSDSDFLGQGIASKQFEVWLYDTVAMTYTRVTSASHSNRDSFSPNLSDDGTIVAFESDSDFLGQSILDSQSEIWLWRSLKHRVYLPHVMKDSP